LQNLERDLKKYQKELERAKMDPRTALIKKEELAKKADELSKEMAKQGLDKMKIAESVKENMEKAMLEKAGFENVDMDAVKMPPQDLDKKISEAQARMNEAKAQKENLEKQLKELEKKLQSETDPEKRKELQSKIEATKKQLEEAAKTAEQAQKEMEGLQLSKEAQETLAKLKNSPEWQEIMKEMERLRKAMQDAEKQGGSERPKLTKEEIEAMKKAMEEFLKTLEDDDARKEYLEKMLEALKNAKSLGQCQGICMGMGLGMGGPGGPGPDNDTMLWDAGKNNHGDPIQGKGKAKPTFAPTERDNTRPGMEMTFEIKAPTFKGAKSSIPYKSVLPSYSKKAESALNKNNIPKDRQEQVKRYFESLKK
jgi:tetratricopeptide (TPR) repeat protein